MATPPALNVDVVGFASKDQPTCGRNWSLRKHDPSHQ